MQREIESMRAKRIEKGSEWEFETEMGSEMESER